MRSRGLATIQRLAQRLSPCDVFALKTLVVLTVRHAVGEPGRCSPAARAPGQESGIPTSQVSRGTRMAPDRKSQPRGSQLRQPADGPAPSSTTLPVPDACLLAGLLSRGVQTVGGCGPEVPFLTP